MQIIEKIQEKTRQEYIEIIQLWIARLSGAIQQKPLKFCSAALALGFFLAVFYRIFLPIIILGLFAAVAVYCIAKENRIS